MSSLKLLFLGDVVGSPGRNAVLDAMQQFRKDYDVIVINAENSAGGKGVTAAICESLLEAGAAVVTTGDHVWDQREIVDYFPKQALLLRPINYPQGTVGQGSVVVQHNKGSVAVIQVQGRTFMQPHLEHPFDAVEKEVERLKAQDVKMIMVEIHAETTSEKIAMGRFLDGKVSLVVGTHTHVQTADESIFPNGTGFLTDAGMCGAVESILGRTIESVLWRFKTSMPTRMPVAEGSVRICGVSALLDVSSGRCLKIERISFVHEASAPDASIRK